MNYSPNAKNVLGTELITCGTHPMTGYFRDGCCHTGPEDFGTHTVCAQMTEEFLAFTKEKGNDLSTAQPAYNFPGLRAGDYWCLCVSRWMEALEANKAPRIRLEATYQKTLEYVSLETLKKYAIP